MTNHKSHSCGCCMSDLNENDNQKNLYELLFAIGIYTSAFFIQDVRIKLIIFITAYIIAGVDVIYASLKNIKNGIIFDENFLMTIATLGAMCVGEYPEAVMVMILYKIGESLQTDAVNKSKRSISSLMDIRPDYAYIETEDGLKKVHPPDVKLGDIIVVKPGEKISLDGVVTEGESSVDTSAITGESVHKTVRAGDIVYSGCICTSGLLKIRTTKVFSESTVSKILELVENAKDKKSKSENYITKFAKVYTPIVVLGAVLLTLIPTFFFDGSFVVWFKRALTFLVISCPCAFVISVPLTFFAGIGACSKQGILIKGSNYMEKLATPDTILFDKTGTLTKGVFEIQKVCPINVSEEELLEYVVYAEYYSNHPIAVSVKKSYTHEIDKNKISSIEEFSGKGVKAVINNTEIIAGNYKLFCDFKIEIPDINEAGTIIYVAKDKQYAGYILITDEIKSETKNIISVLKSMKIKTTMLTGDTEKIARNTGEIIGIDEIKSHLLPQDKVEILEYKLLQKQANKSVLFVGDGINDAPVLKQADVGISMGALGSDAAIEASDVVIMNDEIEKIPVLINIARKTMRIVKENIIFAITVKVIFLILGALGYMSMWGAVFADVGVTCIAVINSLRTLQTTSFIKE